MKETMRHYDVELHEEFKKISPIIGERKFILWQDPEDKIKTCGGYFEYTEEGEWVQI